jgi:hypothetical protein
MSDSEFWIVRVLKKSYFDVPFLYQTKVKPRSLMVYSLSLELVHVNGIAVYHKKSLNKVSIQYLIIVFYMYSGVHFVPHKMPYLPSHSSVGNQHSKKDRKNHAHGPFVRFSSTYQQLE